MQKEIPTDENDKFMDVPTATESQPFANPICQDTYEALPRIYGYKHKKKASRFRLKIEYKKHCCRANQDLNEQLTHKRDREYNQNSSTKLSEPRKNECTNRYCFCKQYQEMVSHTCKNSTGNHSTEKHFNFQNNRKNKNNKSMKHASSFQADDMETSHKVMGNQQSKQFHEQYSCGILELLAHQPRTHTETDTSLSHHRRLPALPVHSLNPIQQFSTHKAPKSRDMPPKRRYHPQGKSAENKKGRNEQYPSRGRVISSFQRSEAERSKHKQLKKVSREIMAKAFKTEANLELRSRKSSVVSISSQSSISLSHLRFRKEKPQTTKFYSLQKKANLASNHKTPPNAGLFRIPQENEYVDFLKQYKPMTKQFRIKDLIKKPNFEIVSSQNSVYFGSTHNKLKHGTGLLVMERQIFQGYFCNNIRVKGSQKNLDGQYQGSYENGQRSGFGSFFWNNGEKFQGEWKDGMKQGFGKWESPSGAWYQGEWSRNRQHGSGTYKHKNSTYKGDFENFLKHGKGEENFVGGDRYVGQYQEGKPHGNGRYEWQDGSIYEGQFVQGLRHGKGTWKDPHANIYVGEFLNDFKHGTGKENYANGEMFEGEFREGDKQQGTFTNSEGISILIH